MASSAKRRAADAPPTFDIASRLHFLCAHVLNGCNARAWAAAHPGTSRSAAANVLDHWRGKRDVLLPRSARTLTDNEHTLLRKLRKAANPDATSETLEEVHAILRRVLEASGNGAFVTGKTGGSRYARLFNAETARDVRFAIMDADPLCTLPQSALYKRVEEETGGSAYQVASFMRRWCPHAFAMPQPVLASRFPLMPEYERAYTSRIVEALRSADKRVLFFDFGVARFLSAARRPRGAGPAGGQAADLATAHKWAACNQRAPDDEWFDTESVPPTRDAHDVFASLFVLLDSDGSVPWHDTYAEGVCVTVALLVESIVPKLAVAADLRTRGLNSVLRTDAPHTLLSVPCIPLLCNGRVYSALREHGFDVVYQPPLAPRFRPTTLALTMWRANAHRRVCDKHACEGAADDTTQIARARTAYAQNALDGLASILRREAVASLCPRDVKPDARVIELGSDATQKLYERITSMVIPRVGTVRTSMLGTEAQALYVLLPEIGERSSFAEPVRRDDDGQAVPSPVQQISAPDTSAATLEELADGVGNMV